MQFGGGGWSGREGGRVWVQRRWSAAADGGCTGGGVIPNRCGRPPRRPLPRRPPPRRRNRLLTFRHPRPSRSPPRRNRLPQLPLPSATGRKSLRRAERLAVEVGEELEPVAQQARGEELAPGVLLALAPELLAELGVAEDLEAALGALFG